MPRAMRVEYPGAIYHVMDRGDRREDIFVNDVDLLLAAAMAPLFHAGRQRRDASEFNRNQSQAIGLGLCLWILALGAMAAQGAQFFRITGPAATTITAFNPDGTLVWSNALAGTNYTVQTVTSLPGKTNWVDYVQLPVTQAVNTNLLVAFNPPAGMALIPAGSFTMGNCMSASEGGSDELPLHTVNVSAVYMDTNLVSYALWQPVYQWATNHGYKFDNAGAGKASNHPVQYLYWYDCVKWCNARSEKEGLVPAYYTSASQTTVYRLGQTNLDSLSVKWNAGYRLPTEAEWEKAARGAAAGHRFPWLDAGTINWSRANYYATNTLSYDVNPKSGYDTNFNSGGYPYTSPAGSFAPNRYGLYDMAGNVWEWCWDWYNSGYYSLSPGTDPRGAVSGSCRVLRGGSWGYYASATRCASRLGTVVPGYGSVVSGFRCVRGL